MNKLILILSVFFTMRLTGVAAEIPSSFPKENTREFLNLKRSEIIWYRWQTKNYGRLWEGADYTLREENSNDIVSLVIKLDLLMLQGTNANLTNIQEVLIPLKASLQNSDRLSLTLSNQLNLEINEIETAYETRDLSKIQKIETTYKSEQFMHPSILVAKELEKPMFTPLQEQILQAWTNKDMTALNSIIADRLKKNPNDKVALMLKLDSLVYYSFSESDIPEMEATLQKLEKQVELASSSKEDQAFVRWFTFVRSAYTESLSILKGNDTKLKEKIKKSHDEAHRNGIPPSVMLIKAIEASKEHP